MFGAQSLTKEMGDWLGCSMLWMADPDNNGKIGTYY